MVGDVGVGSDYPVAVQSMTTTKDARRELDAAADR